MRVLKIYKGINITPFIDQGNGYYFGVTFDYDNKSYNFKTIKDACDEIKNLIESKLH